MPESEDIHPGIVHRFLSFAEDVERFALADPNRRVGYLCSTANMAWAGHNELKARLKNRIRRYNEITMWIELDNLSTIQCFGQSDGQSMQHLLRQFFHEVVIACTGETDNEVFVNPLELIQLGIAEHITVIH